MEPFSPLSQQDLPLEIVKGQTFFLPVTYLDDEGDPIDLSNYTAKMQVRKTAGPDTDPIIEASTENALITITGASGLVEVTIPAGTTAGLTAQLAVYDLFVYGPSGSPTERILSGPMKITESVTK